MALSEIEKLERRYAENPQGLTFAPLAEVHRKNGDVARALELLRLGLELHPDYTPASIVLGRCHLDLGDLPAAETAFAHVLGLDGENVIALKALADISERQHHFDQAERWLRTLLSVDRSNDEARSQLERIETARRDSASAPPPPALAEELGVSSASVASEGDILDVEEPAAGREATVAEAVEPPAAAAPAMVPHEEPVPMAGWISPAATEAVPPSFADLEPSLTGDDVVEPPPPGLEIEEPEALDAPVEPLSGLIGRDVDQPDPARGDFSVELSEDIILRSSGGHEFQVPDAAAEFSEMRFATPSSPFGEERAPVFGGLEESPAPPAPPQSESTPARAAAADDSSISRWPSMGPGVAEPEPVAAEPVPSEPVAGSEQAAATEPAVAQPEAVEPPRPVVVSEPEPELVVTETMAEVLLHQGHPAEALRVYRELEVRNAGDPRLRQKIAELEDESRPPSAEPAEPPSARRAYTAAETGGQSLRAFFQALLAARPPAAPLAPAVARPAALAEPQESSGAPTRPAADALSLSSVFGEETTAHPPAVPATGAAAGSGVSFDDFYSPPGAATAPKPRSPDPKNDDLDQFHAWLQNLKR